MSEKEKKNIEKRIIDVIQNPMKYDEPSWAYVFLVGNMDFSKLRSE